MAKRSVLSALSLAMVLASVSFAAPPGSGSPSLREPVYRVSKNIDGRATTQETEPAGHPIDPALEMARQALEHIRRDIRDYTATLVKRETIDGQLQEAEFMAIKIRHRQVENGQLIVPFSIYIKYLKPPSKRGQEAIWVEGQNNNKIAAHGTGLQGLITVYLDPEGFLATRGTNYAIYDLGIENLVLKLIERGEQAKRFPCQVQFFQNARINGRSCTLIQVTHPEQRPELDFHVARIFIDDQLKVPVRYAAYGWPQTPGGQPPLIEEFTYLDIQPNVGLTDWDFNPENPNYAYP